MKAFFPPKHSPVLHWIADTLYFPLMKATQNISEIVISEEDRAMLASLKDKRTLLFTNHPTTSEPPVTYHFSHLIGTHFEFMASRQVFDWNFGLMGKILNNLGAYSVIAGATDRESMKTTRSILSSPGGKLVLYPEGEPTSGENDSLMPFQPGVAQLSFWALEDAKKLDPNADIWIAPGFLKYVFTPSGEEMTEFLSKKISKMEKIYKIDPGSKNILRRFLTLGRVLLEEVEKNYGIIPEKKDDFDFRVGRVRHHILDNVAKEMQVEANYPKDQDAIIKIRYLFSQLELISIGYEDPKVPKLSKKQYEWAKREVIIAFDFVVMKKNYIIDYPSSERLYEWLTRFESYVYKQTPRALGGIPPQKERKVYVKFAKPFNLGSYYDDYKKDKRKAVEKMITDLRGMMQKMLDESLPYSKPIVTPGDIGPANEL
jgi:hypothetical protein